MARNRYWPDRDDEEIPGTLADELIDRKRERGWLGLDDYARMADLPERQMDGLTAYVDMPLADMRQDCSTVRLGRWAWKFVAKLSKEELTAAKGRGLPLKQLPPARLAELLRGIGGGDGLENARLYVPEGPLPREPVPFTHAIFPGMVRYTIWVRDPQAPAPAWTLGDLPRQSAGAGPR